MRRRNTVLLALLGGVLALVWTNGGYLEPDVELFAAAGSRLWRGDLRGAYADASVQVGPLTLLLAGLADAVASSVRVGLGVPFGLISTAVTILLSRVALRSSSTAGMRAASPATFTLAVLLGGIGWVVASSGHAEELAVGVFWLVATHAARRDQPGTAAGALVLAAAVKQSGILGLPLLLLLPTFRRALVAGAGVVVATVAIYVPTFGQPVWDYTWVIRPQSLLTFFRPPQATFTWTYRLLQALVCVAVGAALALVVRRRPAADPAAVVLGLLGMRLATDPLVLYYYWAPIVVVLLVVAARDLRPPGEWLAAGAVSWVFVGAGVALDGTAYRAAAAVLVAAVLYVAIRLAQGNRPFGRCLQSGTVTAGDGTGVG